jgi:carbamate kinase
MPLATLLSMVQVDPGDPGFRNPTKFVGPVYEKGDADRLARERGWAFKQDGAKWRRVVASPAPRHIFEIRPVRWLLERGTVVICAGGGGIPTMYEPGAERKLVGVEAVVDKDLCSELLAREVGADLFVMATDAEAVFTDWGTPKQRGIHKAHPDALARYSFPAGSMGPKVDAACQFARATGHTAAIGALADIPAIVRGERGTLFHRDFDGISWHS